MHPEFQLPAAPSALDIHILEQMLHHQLMLKQISENLSQADLGSSAGLDEKDAIQFGKALFEISEAIRLAKANPNNATPFLNTAPRFIAEIKARLKEHEVEIIDHTGESYPTSVIVKVLDWEIDPSIDKQFISETIEPTIYYKKKLLKMGEVIVKKKA